MFALSNYLGPSVLRLACPSKLFALTDCSCAWLLIDCLVKVCCVHICVWLRIEGVLSWLRSALCICVYDCTLRACFVSNYETQRIIMILVPVLCTIVVVCLLLDFTQIKTHQTSRNQITVRGYTQDLRFKTSKQTSNTCSDANKRASWLASKQSSK